MKLLTKAAVVALGIAAAGWLYATPYLTVQTMRQAAQDGKPDVVADHVDFPVLRENLKGTLNARIAAEMGPQAADNPMAVFAGSLASVFAEKLVDALVTPEALAAMLRGKKPSLERDERGADKPADSVKVSSGYESWERFVVTAHGDTGEEDFSLVFVRHGLASWKLSAVRFPPT